MATAIVQEGKVSVSGRRVGYQLRRMPRRRHVHLSVQDEGVIEVRAPWRFSTRRAEAVILEHAPWVIDALDQALRRRAARPVLADGSLLRLLDDELRLRIDHQSQLDMFEAGSGGRCRPAVDAVRRDGRYLRVSLARTGQQQALREALEGWYREVARGWCESRVAHFGEELGLRPARITIRGQRTRWGSCSSKGTLSLNWRLMLVPSPLADYIVVHELSHLRHMDHSARFWALVGSVLPDYRERKLALDDMQDHLAL